MAIKTFAGVAEFEFRNTGREAANPPVVFSDIWYNQDFAVSFWVYCQDHTDITLFEYMSRFGMGIKFMAINGAWYLVQTFGGSQAGPALFVSGIAIPHWQVFVIRKNGLNFEVWGAGESVPGDPSSPLVLTLAGTLPFAGNSDLFLRCVIRCSPVHSICNFKVWNRAITSTEIQQAPNQWLENVGIPPVWACTMRTRTDTASICQPYTSTDWEAGHDWTSKVDRSAFDKIRDPVWLETQPCNAWIYPVFKGPTIISVNPGTSPAVPTVYKSTQFYEFEDVGQFPQAATVPFWSAKYYALPSSSVGGGLGATDSWGLYIDHNGVEQGAAGNSLNRFGLKTGVALPAAATPELLYAWQYGGQFTYPGQVPAVPTAQANLSNILLFVTFAGITTGLPGQTVEAFAGLFAIDKGGPVADKYNKGKVVKIPDPTIRTAFIGE